MIPKKEVKYSPSHNNEKTNTTGQISREPYEMTRGQRSASTSHTLGPSVPSKSSGFQERGRMETVVNYHRPSV